jgi:hypothetical protein
MNKFLEEKYKQLELNTTPKKKIAEKALSKTYKSPEKNSYNNDINSKNLEKNDKKSLFENERKNLLNTNKNNSSENQENKNEYKESYKNDTNNSIIIDTNMEENKNKNAPSEIIAPENSEINNDNNEQLDKMEKGLNEIDENIDETVSGLLEKNKKKKDWKSWSLTEKVLFYEAIANGANYSSLQKLFKNMKEVNKLFKLKLLFYF